MKIGGLAWLAFALAITTPAKSDGFKEENAFFRVTIGGHVFRLEGLVVKHADAAGRLPIALITHGWPPNQQAALDTHVESHLGQARDMASRGWLAAVVIRRGFGQSDGPVAAPVSCRSPSESRLVFSADADDLQATLDVLAQRPDADPARMIAMGVSTGGAAVIALSARNPKGLVGVVNFSGGIRFPECPKGDELVDAFRAFGAASRVPTLWMYAKNDSFFSPDLVEHMRNAFLDGGGDVKLVMFDPIPGQDGHYLFYGRRFAWLPQIDGFLRYHKLPTWQRQDVDRLIKQLSATERDRAVLENYISAPFEKALARASGSKQFVWTGFGEKSVADARKIALGGCQRQKPQDKCDIVLENDNMLGVSR